MTVDEMKGGLEQEGDGKSVIGVEGQACRIAIFQRPAAEINKLHWATLDESWLMVYA